MKYITFLGNLRYDKTVYQNFGNEIETEYFQIVVIDRFKSIDQMFVLSTKDVITSERYSAMTDQIVTSYPHVKICPIEIEEDVDFFQVLGTLQTLDMQGQSVIMDVTHCLRSIPIKVWMSIQPIKDILQIDLKHIYYGQKDQHKVLDLLDSFLEYEIVEVLRRFDQTLKISEVPYLNSFDDDDINELFQTMKKLNYYIEIADMKNSIQCAVRIKDLTRKIVQIKQSVIFPKLPYIEHINEKFKTIDPEADELLNQREFIRILIDHKYIQTAATFISNGFEQWFVHAYGLPEDYRYSSQFKFLISPGNYNQDAKALKMDVDSLLKDEKKLEELIRHKIKNSSQLVSYEENITRRMPQIIDLMQNHGFKIHEFYSVIRNKINHGSKIQFDDEKVIKVLFDMNDRLYQIRVDFLQVS